MTSPDGVKGGQTGRLLVDHARRVLGEAGRRVARGVSARVRRRGPADVACFPVVQNLPASFRRPGGAPRGSSATVRLATYFPFAVTDPSRRPGWARAETDALRRSSGHWRVPHPDADLGLQPYGTETLDHLVATMPTALLELVGHETLVAVGDLDAADRGVLHNPGHSLQQEWSPLSARVTLWNVGVGLACLTYELPRRHGLSYAQLRPITRRLVREELMPVVSRLARGILRPLAAEAAGEAAVSALWSNVIYLVRPHGRVSVGRLDELAEAIIPDGTDYVYPGLRRSAVRIGINSCVVVPDFADEAVETLTSLAGVHQVCWATALIHNAALEQELSSIKPDEPDLRLSNLQRQGEQITSTYHSVRTFRLRYSSVEAHLDGPASLVWRGLEDVWKFRLVLESLDGRLDFLQALHQQLSTRLQDRRSRLLNELVLAFTFLSIFGIVIAALTYVTIDPFTVGEVTTLALASAFLVTALAYALYKAYVSRR